MKPTTRYVYRPALRASRALRTFSIGILDAIGETTQLLWRCIGSVLTFSFSPGDVLNQMSVVGVNSMPLVLLTIAFSGMVLALYTAQQLVQMGLGNYVGGMVAITMSREAAPVLSAIVVAARAGSAIAAEIGSMKVSEQIDALRALAVDPVHYLVVPRFIALVLMLPAITMLANVTGTAGGYLVAASAGVSGGSFLSSIRHLVSMSDINSGLFKTLIFGAIIALVSCYQGLNTRGGAVGVGRATTASVVISIVFIYVADFLLVRFFFPGNNF
ncbi:MAG: ABC transporter permease [Armatimonadetes bacterium]|nr:ABC transporter permease [Armatimonadota bacterium]